MQMTHVTETLAQALRIYRRIPRLLWGGGMVVLVIGAYLAWPVGGEALSEQSAKISTFQVSSHPLVQSLALVGKVEPGKVVNVTAPFDGPVQQKVVEFGARVDKERILLVLDSSEVDLKLREAEVEAIKAAQNMESLLNWNKSTEVVRARNSVLSAEMKLEELTRKEQDSKALVSRGIIPRNEYETALSALKAQRLQLGGARQDLNAILKKGDEEHVLLAQLKLDNATDRLAELKRQKSAGVVKAGVSGLVLRPAAESGGKDSSPENIEIGSRVTKGQVLLSVADTETLRVRARVNEMDVNSIAEGQVALVSGEAFGSTTHRGRVVQVSVQAEDGNRRGSASFEVVVAVTNLSLQVRRRARIGMSANLSIIVYENPVAMVIPIGAVKSGAQGPFVLRQAQDKNSTEIVPVSVGRTTQAGIEILTGLQEGDMITVEGAMPIQGKAQFSPSMGGAPSSMSGEMMQGGSMLGGM